MLSHPRLPDAHTRLHNKILETSLLGATDPFNDEGFRAFLAGMNLELQNSRRLMDEFRETHDPQFRKARAFIRALYNRRITSVSALWDRIQF